MGDARRDAWGERYRANPGDPDAAINYARALRRNGQRPQAVAVLEQAAIQNPKHRGVLGAYGRALADDGHYTAGGRRARPRPGARATGLAHPLGARRGARSDGPSRGSATLLRHRAEDRARRAVGLVQSRSLLRALQGPGAGGDHAAAGGRTAALSIRACARTSLSSSVCRGAGPKRTGSRPRVCPPMKAPPMSLICGRCWRCRTAGSSPRLPSSPWSGLREAERSNQPLPFRLRAHVRQQPIRTRQSTRPATRCESAMSLPFRAPSSLGSSAIRRRSRIPFAAAIPTIAHAGLASVCRA